MKQSPSDTYDWYDENDALQPAYGTPARVLPGPSMSRQNIGWWAAVILFAALWMFESWSVTSSSFNKEDLGHLVESFWSLLLALAACYGIFWFCKPRHRKLGLALSIISGIVLILQHMT